MLYGPEAVPVTVEADASDGLPQFEMVGFLSAEVKEARERVRTALRNCGYRFPAKKITIKMYNSSPMEYTGFSGLHQLEEFRHMSTCPQKP